MIDHDHVLNDWKVTGMKCLPEKDSRLSITKAQCRIFSVNSFNRYKEKIKATLEKKRKQTL